MSALPYPTPTRLRLAEAIAAKEIRHYFWLSPWSCDTVRDANVSARVNELVSAGLADLGMPEGGDSYSTVVLTGEGKAWRARALDPTPERVAFVCDHIAARAIRWYGTEARNWLTKEECTAQVTELVKAGIVEIPPCEPGGWVTVRTTEVVHGWLALTAKNIKISDGGPVSTSPETGPVACRRTEWCVLPDDGHSAWECSVAESTEDEERTEGGA